MSTHHHCDRCGAELWAAPTATARWRDAEVTSPHGSVVFELCEGCSVALRTWVTDGPQADGRA